MNRIYIGVFIGLVFGIIYTLVLPFAAIIPSIIANLHLDVPMPTYFAYVTDILLFMGFWALVGYLSSEAF